MPSLENLSQHFKGKPFIYIAIHVGESIETVRDFIEGEKVTFPNLVDTDTKVSTLYGIRSHPMKFLINHNGNLIGTANGYQKWDTDEMKRLVQMLVSKKG